MRSTRWSTHAPSTATAASRRPSCAKPSPATCPNLWRQKEQFSDGVGYGWIDGLKAHAEAIVSDTDLTAGGLRFLVNPPTTKEAWWYRSFFEQHFPGEACAKTVPGGMSIACSSPVAIAWDATFANAADPSGRAVAGVHNAAVG